METDIFVNGTFKLYFHMLFQNIDKFFFICFIDEIKNNFILYNYVMEFNIILYHLFKGI